MSKGGAPIGNDFWKLRHDLTADGKKLSVYDIIDGAKEYINRCVTEKLTEVDYVGKDATMVDRPKMIVMSIYGLCHHLGIAIQTWRNWKGSDEKYLAVLTRIETTMTAYNIEGASAGLLQQNIIARIEGLADKTENTETKPAQIIVQSPESAKNIDDLKNQFENE